VKSLILTLLLPLQVFALTKVKLGLNWKAEPEFGGFYAAKELGFYEKAGLDVEIIEGAAGIPITQMVATGQVEFGVTSGDLLILGRSNGADIKSLFTVYQKSPQCVMVRADSKIKSFKDLLQSDYTLSATPGALWLTYLQKKYSTSSRFKNVPYQGGVTNFLNDPKLAQQCYAGSEPELAAAKGVKTRTLLIADAGFDNYAAILFTSQKLLTEKLDLTKRFVEASRKGWEAYVKDPTVAHHKITKINPAMDSKTIKTIFDVQRPLMAGSRKIKFGQQSQERWNLLIQQMLELGLIKKPISAQEVFVDL